MWNNHQFWHRFCRSADSGAGGPATLVWRLEAVPICSTWNTNSFSGPSERECYGKGTKKCHDSRGLLKRWARLGANTAIRYDCRAIRTVAVTWERLPARTKSTMVEYVLPRDPDRLATAALAWRQYRATQPIPGNVQSLLTRASRLCPAERLLHPTPQTG